ncbi:hypothetical protein Ddc_18350 [Ditylenchus destructor]|nr:hypothetical protein Ddc_18350 [Ditylenchus destructor]
MAVEKQSFFKKLFYIFCTNLSSLDMRRKKYLCIFTMFIVAFCVMLCFRFTAHIVFELDSGIFCDDENMIYNISILTNPESKYILKGKKFNCAYLEQLNNFHLSDRYALKTSFKVGKFPEDIVFIFGTSASFFKSLRTALYSIQRTFAYAYKKIVVYDLGGLSNNATILIPILLYEGAGTDEADKQSEKDTLFLHSYLLKYLPLHTASKNDIEMQEANMIIVHKSEYTRQILKWALLCASEKECIQPTGSVFECDVHSEGLFPDGTCNRLDQSAFSILINNAEESILRSNGPATNFISHRTSYHPSRLRDRHLLLKKKSTLATVNTCAIGKERLIPEDFVTNSAIQLDLGPNQQRGFFRYVLNVCRGPHYVDFRISKKEYAKLLNDSHV